MSKQRRHSISTVAANPPSPGHSSPLARVQRHSFVREPPTRSIVALGHFQPPYCPPSRFNPIAVFCSPSPFVPRLRPPCKQHPRVQSSDREGKKPTCPRGAQSSHKAQPALSWREDVPLGLARSRTGVSSATTPSTSTVQRCPFASTAGVALACTLLRPAPSAARNPPAEYCSCATASTLHVRVSAHRPLRLEACPVLHLGLRVRYGVDPRPAAFSVLAESIPPRRLGKCGRTAQEWSVSWLHESA
ncbi:hypothetical protein BJ546DRAFT_157704 [Cryomyces antarcticus]